MGTAQKTSPSNPVLPPAHGNAGPLSQTRLLGQIPPEARLDSRDAHIGI